MMDPEKQRVDYGAQLRPPPGYALRSALATTYSLDLETLACATLSLNLGQTLEGSPEEEKLALLESIDNLRTKLLVFHHASGVHVPPRYSSLYALLEPLLVPVQGAGAFSAFHPKLWLLRFKPLGRGEDLFRLVVLSRNLTFDRSWDVAVSLNGERRRGRSPSSEPLIDFLRQLPAPGETAAAIEGWCTALRNIVWQGQKPFEEQVRLLFGRPDQSPALTLEIERKVGELLVVSPFVDADDDGRLHSLGTRAPDGKRMLVSRGDTLDRLGQERLEGWNCYSIPDAIVDGEERLEEGAARPNDLHAKMVVATQGRQAVWHVGSANMTNAAFGRKAHAPRNTECMVRLVTASRQGGASALVQQWFDAGLIVRHRFTEPASIDTTQDNQVRQLVHALAGLPWCMTAVQAEGDTYTVQIDAPAVPTVPAGLEVSVELLCRPSAQQLASSIRWPNVRLSEISAFVTVRVTSVKTQPETRLTSFALMTDLVTPVHEARRQAVFRDIVATPQRLVRYLALLVDPGASKSKWRRGMRDGDGHGEGVFGFDGNAGLYEQLLRAASRSPARIARAVQIVDCFEGKGMEVPKGLPALLQSFDQVLQEVER